MHVLLRSPNENDLAPEDRFEMFVRRNESAAFTSPQKTQIVKQFHAGLSRIVKQAQQRGVKVVLCDSDASPIRRLSGFNRTVAEVAAQESALLVDIDSIFEQRSKNQLVGFEFIEDYVHPRPDGHKMIAWHIYAAMEAADWFGASREAQRSVFEQFQSKQQKIVNAANPTWFFNQGYMLARQGHTQQAIAKYRETLAIAPGYEAAMVNLAHLLISRSEDEQAGLILDQLLLRFPKNVSGRILNSVILAREGDEEGAVAEFRRAIIAFA